MKSVQKQAALLLQRQIEHGANDPLNSIYGEAVSHVITRLLGAEGFTILVASTRNGKVEGLALSGGTYSPRETMLEILKMTTSVAQKFGMETKVNVNDMCDCPEFRTKRDDPKIQ